jgi:hypothetical protein
MPLGNHGTVTYLLSNQRGDDMTTPKTKRKKSSSKPRTRLVAKRSASPAVVSIDRAVVPEPVTDVVTEKTYITTEPEIEIRKPATLAQALTEPAVAVVKPKTTVRKVQTKTRRRA